MTLTRSTPLLALLGLVAALPMLLPSAARAHDSKGPKRVISLSATGSVKAAPDKVDITTGVTSQAPTASEALAKNTEAMTEVVAALKAEGLDAKDIQTTDFSVQPLYEERKDGGRSPNIVGYQVTNSVFLTVRDIGKLGRILDKVVTLGANEINSIAFGISEPDQLKDEARKLAMKDAIAKANLYADAAGVKLGKILTITEESGVVMPRMATRAAAMDMASRPVPIEAGTATVEVRINATFELE